MRVCTRCQESSDFGPNKARPDGLQFYCRACVRDLANGYRAANPEKFKERDRRHAAKFAEKKAATTREWRAANLEYARARDRQWGKDNSETKKARARAAYLANRDERLRQAREYRDANRERIREASKEYTKRNPDVAWRGDANRRARERAAFVEQVDRAVIYERDGGVCGICSKRVSREDASVDHIVPLSKGGKHSYLNTRLAHIKCNVQRGNRGAAQIPMLV